MRDLENCFKGLADPNRLRIINLLLHGERCVCDLQRILDSPQPNVSRHLAYLKHAGLVLDRRDGFRIFYRLVEHDDAFFSSLFDLLRATFTRDKTLRDDLRKLRRAIEAGDCNAVPEAFERSATSYEESKSI